MPVRLAIHAGRGFSRRWLDYCRARDISHEVLDCRGVAVMNRLRQFDGLLWHFQYWNPTDQLMARSVLRAAGQMGLAVFPDHRTSWHYDDKLAQKYLLESVNAPCVPTHAFYRKQEALAWLERAEYPLVFKLRTGGGAFNVRLVSDFESARVLCRVAFGRGFRSVPRYLSDAGRKVRALAGWEQAWGTFKRVPRRIMELARRARQSPREKGYVLFQDFIPGNQYDTRVVVVGGRAWGYRRSTRPGDFRASGSKVRGYDPEGVDPQCLQAAFEVVRRLRLQCAAFDFVRGVGGEPLIVELSYGFGGFEAGTELVSALSGYWDEDLTWRQTDIWPQDAMVIDLVAEIAQRS